MKEGPMLDANLIEQLKSVFSPLENKIDLVYQENDHADLGTLLEMLKAVADTNSKISVVKSESSNIQKAAPTFYIAKNGVPTGITFKGIPNGHEFTSFILAILNADGKGKFPDTSIVERIKNLKGSIHLKTYISLTCENCPEVVQALNQMALFHSNFTHEMIDGSYFQDEITNLGIQGVPSVVVQSATSAKMIHSGRIHLLDLLTKLEEHFGVEKAAAQGPAKDLGKYDVVIIGGGPAGVSAAIYTVRKGLKTAIITEKIGGQVNETNGIENLISVVYTEGPKLAASLNEHLRHYPVDVLENRRVQSLSKLGNENKIELNGGDTLQSSAVIIATGAKWRELGVPGEKDYMGRGVAYCPHCDGPFYKGKKVAVIGGGNSGVEASIDLAGIVKEVVLFEFMDQLKADQILVEKLKSLPNVSIITSAKTKQVLGNDQKVLGLEYIDQKSNLEKRVDLDGVFIQIGLVPNSQFLKGVVELTKFGEVVVDDRGRTSVPGIYAAGDVTTTPYKQIIISMGEGAKAALAAFEDRMRSGVDHK